MKRTFLTIGFIGLTFSMISCDPSSKKKKDVDVEVVSSNTSISDLEAEVVTLFESAYVDPIDYEKREQIFKNIDEKLLSISKNPESKDYLFEGLKGQNVSIVTSDDGNFRVFSWDDMTGGSMRNYTNLYQYFGSDVPVVELVHNSQELDDILTSNIDQIYSLEIDNVKYYLVLGLQKTGGNSIFETLQAISTSGNVLNFNDNIITVDKVLKNNIFSANEVVVPNQERLITYDKNAKVITQIVMDENGNPMINKYSFNGKLFE